MRNRNFSMESAKVMAVAFELGFAIALPITLLATLGKWMDEKYGTGYFIYLGIVTAIILTTTWMYRRFAAYIDKLNEAAHIKKQ